MNKKQFSSMLAAMLSPMVVSIVAAKLGLEECEAAQKHFRSRLYVFISDESSKVWHYSPQLLADLLVGEVRSGKIDWPEEAG